MTDSKDDWIRVLIGTDLADVTLECLIGKGCTWEFNLDTHWLEKRAEPIGCLMQRLEPKKLDSILQINSSQLSLGLL